MEQVSGSQPGTGPVSPTPDAWLRVTVQGSAFTDGMSVFPLSVDEREVVLSGPGTHVVPIRSGRRSLHVATRSLWRYGQAELGLDVVPDQTVDVFYAPPYHQLAPGAVGLAPQRRRGLAVVITIGALAVAALVLLGLVLPGLDVLGVL
jgi:hypothetical protein